MIYHIKIFCGKLNKKMTEEVGTEKSPTKPLYLTMQEVQRLQKEKKETEDILNQKYEIDNKIKNIKLQIQEEELTLQMMQEMETIHNAEKLDKEKINMHIKEKQDLEIQKEELQGELNKISSLTNEKNSFKMWYIMSTILLIFGIIFFTLKNYEIASISIAVLILLIIISSVKKYSEMRKKLQLKKEEESKKRRILSKIELIQNDVIRQQNEIEKLEEDRNLKLNLAKENIRRKYEIYSKIKIEDNISNSNIIQEQNYINELKLNLNRYELNKKYITEKAEHLLQIEEKLNSAEQCLTELLEYQNALNIAKEELSNAYYEMRESITPKFTENLSRAVKNITDEKYKKVKVNEKNELMLENANRKLCECKSIK